MTTRNKLQFKLIDRVLKTCASINLIIFALIGLSAMTLAQTAMRPDRGTSPAGNYSITDIENISLTNGNLNLSIPLASLPPVAGGKLSWTVLAEYNSKLWDGVTTPEPANESHGPYTADTLQLSDLGGWRIGGSYIMSIHDVSEDATFELPTDSTDPEWYLTGYRWKIVLIVQDGVSDEIGPIEYRSYAGFVVFCRGSSNYI